ncbi:MAG: hypothetical protein AB7K24_05560 [Gemmataceae bacterium]
MSSLASFLRALFEDGAIVFSDRPRAETGPRAEAARLLGQIFADERLEVAGPPLDFRPEPALAASEFVRQVCWFLLQRGETVDELERCLTMPGPTSCHDHLSVDLVFRYLPVLHRRAAALAPEDPLTLRLTDVLRQWPLSGVRADVGEAPTTPPDFDGHRGLQLCYAERWAENEKHAWLPAGAAFEFLPLVYHLLDRPLPAAVVQRLESQAHVGSPE